MNYKNEILYLKWFTGISGYSYFLLQLLISKATTDKYLSRIF